MLKLAKYGMIWAIELVTLYSLFIVDDFFLSLKLLSYQFNSLSFHCALFGYFV